MSSSPSLAPSEQPRVEPVTRRSPAPDQASLLDSAFTGATAALNAYLEAPDQPSTREATLAALRSAAAQIAAAKTMPFALVRKQAGELLAAVRTSGVHDAGVAETDLESARGYVQRGEPGLVAAMLVAPAWQWPNAPLVSQVPPALIEDYLAWQFVAPQGFAVRGQAGDFPELALQRMEQLLAFVRGKTGETVRAALIAYLKNGSCIPYYFSEGSLRRHYEVRAQLLQWTKVRPNVELAPTPRAGRRLRVGFVSRHFGPQTETYCTIPTFEQLDPERFDVQLFAIHENRTPLEDYCRSHAAGFHVLPENAAKQVDALRDAKLDVAVFGTNVTAVFHEITRLALHRVAPLQVANISSCTTTGMPEIDLYASGVLTEGPDAEEHFSERLGLVAGPAHWFNYEADRQEPSGTWTRAALGIPEDALLFVSGSNFYKIIPEMQEVWARLLAALPGSRLLLHPFNPNWSSSYPIKRFSADFDRVLAAHGVSTDRLVLSTMKFPSRTDVKELLRVGDVYLDTFPFAGVTSLVDPLELGMPVVVWEGSTFRARMGAALLRGLGVEELIARDSERYFALALELARDPERRKALGERIAHEMSRAPAFMDPLAASDAFGALLERAYDELSAVGRAEFRRRRDPIIVPVPSDPLAVVQLGVARLESDDLAGAEACAWEVLGANPVHVAARQLMGAVLLRKGKPVRAVDYLLGAVQRSDADGPLWYDLAVALYQSGRPPQAVEALQASLRIDSKQIDAWLFLARLAELCGQLDLRDQSISIARALAPDDQRMKENSLPICDSSVERDLQRALNEMVNAESAPWNSVR